MPEASKAYLQIGEVADRTGVTQRTLRFYEEKGLLKPPTRMEGGFRLYFEDDVVRVEQIRRLQNLLGIALAEIKEMVDADEVLREIKAQYRHEADVVEKKRQLQRATEVVEKQYAIVRQKVEQMQEMRADLEKRLKRFAERMAELEGLEQEAVAGRG